MSRSALTALAFILAVSAVARAQQQPQSAPGQVNTPWAVSVVHTMDFQKMIARMKQQEQGRLGVPASAPQFIYNVATGLVVDNEGHIVTRLANLDLDDKDQTISITTGDGAIHAARLIGVDCATGFAVLEVASLKIGPPDAAASTSLSNGLIVSIISTDVQGKLVPTQGGNKVYLTSLMRRVQGTIGTGSIYSKARGAMTLFSSSLLSRNDSSVVTTLQNQVIGIAQYAGFGRAYLFPIEFIRDTVAKRVIEKNGNVRAGWLGAKGENVSRLADSEATALGLASKSGVIVREIAQGSPAAAGGIMPNDVIVGVDSFDIAGAADLSALLQSSPEGRKIKLRAIRNHQPLELNVVLGARADNEWYMTLFEPDWGETVAAQRAEIEKRLDELKKQHWSYQKLPATRQTEEALRELDLEIRQIYDALMALGPETPKKPDQLKQEGKPFYEPSLDTTESSAPGPLDKIGLAARDLTPQLASYFRVKGGVLVVRVRQDSPAARAGIRTGDVIVGAQDRETVKTEELGAMLAAQRNALTLKIVRDYKPLTINLNIQ
jgi:S1-C subfamily serine protease